MKRLACMVVTMIVLAGCEHNPAAWDAFSQGMYQMGNSFQRSSDRAYDDYYRSQNLYEMQRLNNNLDRLTR